MKRIKVFGLLIAAFAFSVMFAATAQAKKAEHGELYLVASGGESHLGTTKLTIHSTSNSSVSHITSATSGTVVSTFTGTEDEGTGKKCNSAGQPSGTVVTFPLSTELGWINKSAGEVGEDFKPASGELLAEFECEGLGVKVKGSVIAHSEPKNEMTNDGKVNLYAGTFPFKNTPESFEGGTTDVLKSQFTGAEVFESESLQEQRNVDVKNHGNSSVCKLKKGVEKCKPVGSETSTIANPAQPEFGRCDKQKGGKYSETNCVSLAEPGKGKYEFVPVPG
jgi:hypothetical protein